MKKICLKHVGPFLLVLLFITGCLKVHERDWNECRLVFGTNADPTGSANFTFHYNNRGLASEWNIENYGTLAQEYDARGNLKKSALTQNGEVTFSISFFYNGGDKVTKEVWFVGTGKDTSDIIYYHYDAQGNLIKTQSFINDYIATGKYSPDGSLLETKLFFGGVPVYAAVYTYNKHLKNPYLAVPGINHLFPYYTPMDLFYGKWRWASLKQVGYDESGNPIVQFEYDPSKTVWQAGPHNYPALVTYFDLLVQESFPYKFEFENCDKDNDYGNSKITAPLPATGQAQTNLMSLLKRDPSKSMKETVREWRQQLKIIGN